MHNFFQADPIEQKLQVKFHDQTLLMSAFVHPSFWNENQEQVKDHNERLEFLGDSILGLIFAEYLFLQHPDLDEGVLSKLRSQLVDAPACARYLQKLEVAPYLLLGKGELMNRGKGRESILANLFEAIIGALYIDQGLESVRLFFFSHFKEDVDALVASPMRNWKAELQDWVQKKFHETPTYEVLEESGPPHERVFHVGVHFQGEIRGKGSGSSKKEAQVEAARAAMNALCG